MDWVIYDVEKCLQHIQCGVLHICGLMIGIKCERGNPELHGDASFWLDVV